MKDKPLDDAGIDFQVTATEEYTEYTFRIHSTAPQGQEWAKVIMKTWLGDLPDGFKIIKKDEKGNILRS